MNALFSSHPATGIITFMHVYQVYLLVHTCDVKLSGQQRTTIEKMPHSFKEFQEKDSQGDGKVGVDDSRLPDLSLGECSLENEHCKSLDENKDEEMTDQGIDNTSSVEGDAVIGSRSNENGEDAPEKTRPGVSWDVFRRQDVPKVTEYLRTHQKEFGVPDSETYDFVSFCLIFTSSLIVSLHFVLSVDHTFGIVGCKASL